jgi:hypothetical protein
MLWVVVVVGPSFPDGLRKKTLELVERIVLVVIGEGGGEREGAGIAVGCEVVVVVDVDVVSGGGRTVGEGSVVVRVVSCAYFELAVLLGDF